VVPIVIRDSKHAALKGHSRGRFVVVNVFVWQARARKAISTVVVVVNGEQLESKASPVELVRCS
jgi:hypothetical protein